MPKKIQLDHDDLDIGEKAEEIDRRLAEEDDESARATRMLSIRVSERFWRELHDYCRFNDVKKSDVLRTGFALYRREHSANER